jgi:hypothetical protein
LARQVTLMGKKSSRPRSCLSSVGEPLRGGGLESPTV